VVGRALRFCWPARNETVAIASDGLRLMGDVWTQPRQSNHADEMTQSSTGQTSEDGNTSKTRQRRSPSFSFCFQTRHGRFGFTGNIRRGWLSLHSAERIMLSPPPPLVVCRQCFLSILGHANVFPGAFRDFSVAPLRRTHYKINTTRSFVLQ
jgi:hypothetical protein